MDKAEEDDPRLASAVLFFDANVSKLHLCSSDCEENLKILCKHRFNFDVVSVIYYHGRKYWNEKQSRYRGWPDSKILIHMLDHVRKGIEKGFLSADMFFIMFTKDFDFLKDAKCELGKSINDHGIEIIDNRAVSGNITISIQALDCKNYGTQGDDNLRCAIYKARKLSKLGETN